MHSRLTHPSSVAVVCPTTPWSANASVATAVVAVVAVGRGFAVVGEFCSTETANGARNKAGAQRFPSQKGLRKSKVGIAKAGCSKGFAKTEGLEKTEGLGEANVLENSVPESGCPTWIRTMTNRFRDCCATITQSGSQNRSGDRTRNFL